MIIQQLIGFWKGDSALKAIFSEFDEMLIIAKEMFEKATSNLFEGKANLEVEMRELVKLDGRLNALQQNIRRDIVMHITVQGSKDILPCLILMSLVKDAERLGDYAKNVLEVVEHFDGFEGGEYVDKLKKMKVDILTWFDDTKVAFDNIDEEQAQKTRKNSYKSEKECDQVAWEMLTSERKDAVAIALLFRFFKRTSAHLGNICTSVIMPLDKLDYYEK
jgi:phosphate uptake regulator